MATFVLTLWTNDPRLAARADAAGVDRIGLDLERLGKQTRQAGRGTWISAHREEELDGIRAALTGARLFARTNPVNPDSADEVERLLARGAEVLMLPMFRTAGEVERFVDLVGGRATVVLLLENLDAASALEQIVRVQGVGEVHVGLNDLTLSLGYGNRFAVLATDLMARIADTVLCAGLRLGLGGIGRAGDDALPVPSDLIYAQYPRLGASSALLARSFLGGELAAEMARTRARLAHWSAASPEQLEDAAEALRLRTASVDVW